jgi:hypothetical protein
MPLIIVIAFSASIHVTPAVSPLFSVGSAGPQSFGQSTTVTTVTLNSTLTVTIGTNHGTLQGPETLQGLNFSLPPIPPSYIVALIVVLFAVVTFGIARNLRAPRVTGFDVEEALEQEKRAEVSQALDALISKLRQGGEYREAVLECYHKISSILEAKSKVAGTWMTAREFEKIASDRLGLHDNPYLSEATRLFEVARYSEHEVTKSEADSAVECLSNLSLILKQGRAENPK